MTRRNRLPLIAAGAALWLLTVFVSAPRANHAWGTYHWARTANPFTVDLGDNVSAAWDASLNTASADWSQSTVLNTAVVAGRARPRNCRPTTGRVEVCNATYGSTGWLGVAQIWANGSHITQGTVKLNDTYFNTAQYNTPAWRALVVCQEVGHTFGLDHQDENFTNPNLGTCMDYTNDPSTNQHPNAHDYQELQIIYQHLDSTTTVGAELPPELTTNGNAARVDVPADLDLPAGWGHLMKSQRGGRLQVFERQLGNNQRVFTFVIWA